MVEMTIGQRAAQAIRLRAGKMGIKPAKFMESIGANRKTLGDWEKRNRNPQAYWLQQLAFLGFDTHWILTGERRYHAPDIDFDIAEYEEEE